MIRIAISAAYDAIASTLAVDAPLWVVNHRDGQCVIHAKADVLDRLRAIRGPGETYSDVILRLV